MTDIAKEEKAVGAMPVLDDIQPLVRNRTADLEVAVEQLQELDQMKAEFVANISHELRTPLSNFVVYLHLLGLNPEKQDAYVATLKREAHRLASIVEDLIFVSRWNPEQQDLDMAPVDINALVETYITDRTPITENSGLALTLKQMPALPKVQADQKRLEQVLDVLLSNAFNYTPSGGQVIVCTQTSRVAGEQWVGFNVSDTGVGIPREEQFKIFDRFYRGTGGHDSGKPGIGLGLAIAREIIDGHQGRIEVESEGIPGKGSIFSVWLPVHAD
jgi:signal transduction histidine kinase